MKPIKEFRYYRRNLPHYEEPGNAYFITFTTVTGLELTDNAKETVFKSIKYHSDKKYKLYACVVMNTHVHLIIKPKAISINETFSLAQIMHSVKSYSAKQINEAMHRQGNVWLEERYDRIIRDDEDYIEKMNYIIYNPVKAGIVKNPGKYQWLFCEGAELSS